MSNLDQFRTGPKFFDIDYLSMFKSLLPRGPIWGFYLRVESTVLQDSATITDEIQDDALAVEEIQDSIDFGESLATTKFGDLLSCFASECARFEQRYWKLVQESVPGLADELLTEWQKQLAILPGIKSPQDIQKECHAKVTNEHLTTTTQYFIDYAATMGFEITISSGYAVPRRRGVARMGNNQPRMGGTSQYSIWHITVVSGTGSLEQLQETFQRIKQAHKVIVWTIL